MRGLFLSSWNKLEGGLLFVIEQELCYGMALASYIIRT